MGYAGNIARCTKCDARLIRLHVVNGRVLEQLWRIVLT